MARHLFNLVQTKNRTGRTRKAHTQKMKELVYAHVCDVLHVCVRVCMCIV